MSVDKFGRYSKRRGIKIQRGPPGPGFKFTSDGNYNVENKQLKNVSDPTNENDAVTLTFLTKQLKQYKFQIINHLVNKTFPILIDTKLKVIKDKVVNNEKHLLVLSQQISDLNKIISDNKLLVKVTQDALTVIKNTDTPLKN